MRHQFHHQMRNHRRTDGCAAQRIESPNQGNHKPSASSAEQHSSRRTVRSRSRSTLEKRHVFVVQMASFEGRRWRGSADSAIDGRRKDISGEGTRQTDPLVAVVVRSAAAAAAAARATRRAGSRRRAYLAHLAYNACVLRLPPATPGTPAPTRARGLSLRLQCASEGARPPRGGCVRVHRAWRVFLQLAAFRAAPPPDLGHIVRIFKFSCGAEGGWWGAAART